MYLRARWYDAQNGRFNRLDPFFGNLSDPQSLHKYAYVHGDPVNGIDPTGRSLVGQLAGFAGRVAVKIGKFAARFPTATGAILGGAIGGIDAWLGGDNILTGVVRGAVIGAVLGRLAAAFPALFASRAVLALGVGFGIKGALDSFRQGKDAQGYFRVFTGILAPLALRQGTIARLSSLTRNTRLNIAKLWKSLPIRRNIHGAEAGVAGSHVHLRQALSPDVKPGVYMYAVDGKGKTWLLAAENANGAKHSSILPARPIGGAQPANGARAAGWLKINANRTVNINTRSGHFMQEQPFTPAEEATWLVAITESMLLEGSLAVAKASATGSIN